MREDWEGRRGLGPAGMSTSGRGPLRLLLVEDDPDAALLVREQLALASATPTAVTHVTRLAAALDACDAGDCEAYDAILLDLSLPDAQDLQALKMLRAAAPRIPVVVLSAQGDEEFARRGVYEGAQEYLVKGYVAPDALARALRHAIERQRAQDRLTRLAFHDPLTGLPNRALLDDRLGLALAAARRGRGHLSVLFLDLDGFKAVNDNLGHDAGDLLLQAVAARLTSCTRGCDTVARLAGDEFVALLPGADRDAATTVARKILAAAMAPYTIAGRAATVTASAGISLYPDDATDVLTLVQRADEAMYRAKRAGKNAYAFIGDEEPAQVTTGTGT